MVALAPLSVEAQYSYEYDRTVSVTIEQGEEKVLDPAQLDDIFYQILNNKASDGYVYHWDAWEAQFGRDNEIFYILDIEKDNTHKWDNGETTVFHTKCKILGVAPGSRTLTYQIHHFSHYVINGTRSKVWSILRINVTVKETDKPQLNLTVNNTNKYVNKGTTITFTPNVEDADVYVNGVQRRSITINETTAIRAYARKQGYPQSETFEHTYYVENNAVLFNETTKEGTTIQYFITDQAEKTCEVAYVNPSTAKDILTIPSETKGFAVTRIKSEAFFDCPSKKVILPNTLTTIEEKGLAFNGIEDIAIPNSVNSIGNYAFEGCMLKKVIIPNTVDFIPRGCFWQCWELQEVLIPESVKKIEYFAFNDCRSLKEISIPNSVTEIGSHAFRGDDELVSVKSMITEPFSIEQYTFSEKTYSLGTLYVPKGTIIKYLSTNGWNRFSSIVEMETTTSLQGDVNQDDAVNGTDLVALSNIILGRKEQTSAADVNGDGSVNGTDIVALSNIILGRNNAPRRAGATGNGLSIEPFDINAGETKEMLIDLTNPNDEVTLVQFDLHLPEGLTVKKNGSDLDFDMADRTSWRKHTLDANEVDGAYRFLLYSSGNTLIEGTSGAIIKVTVVADASFTGGKIVIDNILLVSPDEKETKPDAYELTIGSPTPDDGSAKLSIDEAIKDIKAGETKEMLIDLTNPNDEVTLVQFDLHLPEGLSIKKNGSDLDFDMADRTSWRKHTLDANEVDGAYRFLLYSSSNTLIEGTEGAIIKVTVVADASFTGGKIVIDNILLVSPDEQETKPEAYEYVLPDPSGISTILMVSDDSAPVYNLRGQRLSAPQKGINIVGGRKVVMK